MFELQSILGISTHISKKDITWRPYIACMAANTGRTAIESHTEYVRSRVRCPECGDYVARRVGAAGDARCVNCATTERRG